MRSSIVLATFLLLCTNLLSQITGLTSVNLGDTAIYSHSATGTPGFSSYYWEVNGGTILSSTETEVNVVWDDPNAGLTTVEKFMLIPQYNVDTRVGYLPVTVNLPVIKYTYDASGNREHRKVEFIVSQLKSAKSNQGNSNKVEDDMDELKIVIFPNPTSGILNVRIDGFDISVYSSALVYNTQGVLVKRMEPLSGYDRIDLSDQPEGVYFLNIITNGKKSNWKIIKQ